MSGIGDDVHPIEVESYRIMRSRIDLSHLPPLCRLVTERVIHASADFDYATDLVCTEQALAVGVAALAAGAPVVADVAMVAVGIGVPLVAPAPGPPPAPGPALWPASAPAPASGPAPAPVGGHAPPGGVICKIGEPLAVRMARSLGITRSAAAVRLAFADAGPGAVWVVGCAPTALVEILRRDVRPALVIGLPVGFAGAVEAKDALRSSGLPAVSNLSEKGGSAVAAAALNALAGAARAGRAEGAGLADPRHEEAGEWRP